MVQKRVVIELLEELTMSTELQGLFDRKDSLVCWMHDERTKSRLACTRVGTKSARHSIVVRWEEAIGIQYHRRSRCIQVKSYASSFRADPWLDTARALWFGSSSYTKFVERSCS
jgi:hypothetical protein